MKGIKKATAKGRVYYYHRATGRRINAEPGSAEFLAIVQELDKLGRLKPVDGALGSLIRDYRMSPEFRGLAARTRVDYDKIFDYLTPLHPMPVLAMDSAFILSVRDNAFRLHRRWFANYVVKVLRLLFAWGLPRKKVAINAAAGTPTIRKPTHERKGNRPWTVEEFYTVLDAATLGVKVAVALGGYAGVSEGDVILLTRSQLQGGALAYTRKKTGVPVTVYLHTELMEILGTVTTDLLVTNRSGKQFTEDGFRASFFKLIRKLYGQGSGLTFHGLRHFVGTSIANEGGDTRVIMSVLGQRTVAMAQHYSDEYDRKIRSKEGTALLEMAIKRNKN